MISRDATNEEIIQLFLHDYKKYYVNEQEKTCREHRSLLDKSRGETRVWYDPIIYHSLHDFNFITTFYTRGKDEPEDDNSSFLEYAWFWKDGKAFAISFLVFHSGEKSTLNISLFIPHFFSRYRTRFLKDFTLADSQVIHRYFLNNSREAVKYVPSIKHPNTFYNVGKNGISISDTSDPSCFVFKTFLSWNILFKDQKEIALELKEKADGIGLDLAIPEEEFNDIK